MFTHYGELIKLQYKIETKKLMKLKILLFLVCVSLLISCDPYRRIRKHVPKRQIRRAMKYSDS